MVYPFLILNLLLIGPITPVRQSEVHGASPPSHSTTTHQSGVLGASSSTMSDAPVISWTESDVQAWLKKTKLDELCEPLDHYDGKCLQDLYESLQNDPKKFEGDMKSDFGMNKKVYVRFKVELSKLCDTKTSEADLKAANQNPKTHVRTSCCCSCC